MATALSAASGGGGARNGLSAGLGSQARRWRLHRDERATASPLKQDRLALSLPQGQGLGSRRRPRGDKPEGPPPWGRDGKNGAPVPLRRGLKLSSPWPL